MAFDIASAELMLPGVPFKPRPFITGWNRLEGRVRTDEFDRALRSEARDPLWFLARQWQFLELKADDAGSPVEARMAMRRTRLTQFSVRGGSSRAFPREIPLEAMVERESPPMDRLALVQVARAFDKALVRAGVSAADRKKALEGMRRAYPLDPSIIEGVSDEEALQLAALLDDELFDAASFLGDDDFETQIDTASGLGSTLRANARSAGAAAKSFWASLYLAPAKAQENAWTPSALEYQFSCATEPGPGQLVLTGDGYAHGRLDWFALDVAEDGETFGEERAEGAQPVEETLSFLPAAIRFAGMPSHRFWEMEDAKVELGDISATTTDIAKILLTEFILVYGNDWCLIPYEVEIGELCDALGLVVHDVFGDATLVRAADRGKDEEWRRWGMFGLETRKANDVTMPRLLVPPTTPRLMESPAIERVVFLRDEMANLVWAAERTVLSAAGIGVDGEQFAISKMPKPPADPLPADGASARYRLGTDSPPNWRPFIPVHTGNSIRSVSLQRARLPRGDPDPMGAILVGPGLAPAAYFINEEEVPRAGRIVTRSFQRVRWLDGRVMLWLGRRTMTGRGEGSSGLEFDVIEEIGQQY